MVLSDAARSKSPALRKRPFAGVHIATIRHVDSVGQIFANALTAADQCIDARTCQPTRMNTHAGQIELL